MSDHPLFPPLPSAVAEEALPEPYVTLLRMMRDGRTFAEIASEIGVRVKAIGYRVQLLRDRLPNGSVPPVTRRISTRRTAETLSETDRRIMSMRAEGRTLNEIADACSISSQQAVYARLKRLKTIVPGEVSFAKPRQRIDNASGEFAEKLECLRCRRDFMSWDKRRNRICGQCKHNPTEDRGGMDEHHMRL